MVHGRQFQFQSQFQFHIWKLHEGWRSPQHPRTTSVLSSLDVQCLGRVVRGFWIFNAFEVATPNLSATDGEGIRFTCMSRFRFLSREHQPGRLMPRFPNWKRRWKWSVTTWGVDNFRGPKPPDRFDQGGYGRGAVLREGGEWDGVRLQWFCPCGHCRHQQGFKNNHIAAPVKVARQQTAPELSWTFRNTPEPSGTFRKLPPEPTSAHAGTLRSCFWNLHGALQNLPEVASGTFPESSGTFRTSRTFPESSGTFRNLPQEPTPAHARTLRNLLEPFPGTCSSDPRRRTPELIWAEDPVSLRCWGKN